MENYVVKDEIKQAYKALEADEAVQKALAFAKEDEENSIQQLIELTMIEAPTFHEHKRAQYMAARFTEAGLENVTIDKNLVVYGTRKGTGNGPTVVVDGHMDTVFPEGTVTEVKRDEEFLHCPGVGDDTAALTMELAMLRAMNAANIQTAGDIIFTATPREEGMGMLGGMKDFMADHHEEVDALIAIDGGSMSGITYEATGMRTAEVNFYGQDGHASGMFGKIANSLNAAARAVAKIAEIRVPDVPGTIFCVSNFHAGNDAGIHAIAGKTTIKYNIRSSSEETLQWLDEQLTKCFDEACADETARWGKDAITWDRKYLATAPAGTEPVDCTLCQAMYHVAENFDIDPVFGRGGCTNATHGIAHGIPSICIGRQFVERGVNVGSTAHKLSEKQYIKNYYKCAQMGILVTLLMTGTPDVKSVL